jgi:uncharacterized protein YbjQ (UPF0145 family)
LLDGAAKSLHQDIAKTLEESDFVKPSSESELRQLLDSVLLTTEGSLPDLKIDKRYGLVVSNVPQRDQTQDAGKAGSDLESRLSLDDMYNVALLDLRYQALRLGANAVVAVAVAFVPRVKRMDTDLFLSAMGTAVSIEGLRGEAEEEAASRHAPLGRGASPRGR